MAQGSSNLSKAHATLIAQRLKVVSTLAKGYNSKAVADLISISKAIEILSQIESDSRPQPQPNIGSPVSVR